MTPDFFSLLDPANPMSNFHPALLEVFYQLLNSDSVDQTTKDTLARLRAQCDIALKGL